MPRGASGHTHVASPHHLQGFCDLNPLNCFPSLSRSEAREPYSPEEFFFTQNSSCLAVRALPQGSRPLPPDAAEQAGKSGWSPQSPPLPKILAPPAKSALIPFVESCDAPALPATSSALFPPACLPLLDYAQSNSEFASRSPIPALNPQKAMANHLHAVVQVSSHRKKSITSTTYVCVWKTSLKKWAESSPCAGLVQPPNSRICNCLE